MDAVRYYHDRRMKGIEGLDERDAAILAERQAGFDTVTGPRVGDIVRMADGAIRRISYVWPDGCQTSDGGSWYLGSTYMSFSGSLYSPIAPELLTDSGETQLARAWFFHHDWAQAHNGVDVYVNVRVYSCTLHTCEGRSFNPDPVRAKRPCGQIAEGERNGKWFCRAHLR
jgi:hypothetical protein